VPSPSRGVWRSSSSTHGATFSFVAVVLVVNGQAWSGSCRSWTVRLQIPTWITRALNALAAVPAGRITLFTLGAGGKADALLGGKEARLESRVKVAGRPTFRRPGSPPNVFRRPPSPMTKRIGRREGLWPPDITNPSASSAAAAPQAPSAGVKERLIERSRAGK